jgi:CBS domain-containing protein
MKVKDIMSVPARFCSPRSDLREVALAMWQHDCGMLPIVDPATRRLTGVITDRDVCMALATTGARPEERTAGDVARRSVIAVEPDDDLDAALRAMADEKVRRLPVVDPAGDLVGVLSLNDVVRHGGTGRGRSAKRVPATEIVRTLAAICEHRAAVEAEASTV